MQKKKSISHLYVGNPPAPSASVIIPAVEVLHFTSPTMHFTGKTRDDGQPGTLHRILMFEVGPKEKRGGEERRKGRLKGSGRESKSKTTREYRIVVAHETDDHCYVHHYLMTVVIIIIIIINHLTCRSLTRNESDRILRYTSGGLKKKSFKIYCPT